jgi:hypothetical protein
MATEKIPQIHKNFTLFSNLELHFIIKALLESSGFQEKLVSKGSLYIKSSSNSSDDDLTFFLIGRSVASFNNQHNKNSLVFIGKLCPTFNKIQLHTISFTEPDHQVRVDIATIKELIKALAEKMDCDGEALMNVMLKIIKQPYFTDRKQNPLFTLPDTRHNSYTQYFDLGIANDANYSGIYYCIAEYTTAHQQSLITIHQYEVEETMHEGVVTKNVIRKDHSYYGNDLNLFANSN